MSLFTNLIKCQIKYTLIYKLASFLGMVDYHATKLIVPHILRRNLQHIFQHWWPLYYTILQAMIFGHN